MRVIRELAGLAGERGPLELAAGFFDGVHRGHQRVILEAVQRARAAGGTAWVLTLDPHPLQVLQPAAAPPLLTSLAHKLDLIGQLGAAGVVVLPFTRALADEEAEDFIRRLRAALPTPAGLVVGANWTFGHAGRGHADLLQRLAPRLALQLTVMEPVYWSGAPISSTRIREQLGRGHLEAAACMFGRFPSVRGVVEPGRQVGRRLGFPTANLRPPDELLPPPGVYATYALLDGVRRFGAAFRPPAPADDLLEVHFLDVDVALYGREVEVSFLTRLRDDRRFDTSAALRAQIARDVADIRRLTAAYVAPQGELRPPCPE